MNEQDLSQPTQQFLVLSGEGVSALNPEHVEALRVVAAAMAGGRSVEATVTVNAESVEEATAEAAEAVQDKPLISLMGMEPDEVAELHQAMEHWRIVDMGDKFGEGFSNGLLELVDNDPERAVAAIGALVGSEHRSARRMAAIEIPDLVRANEEAVLALWEKLLQDEDRDVAGEAAESIGTGYHHDHITLDQAARLARVYHRGPTASWWTRREG